MVITKYVVQNPPAAFSRTYLAGELRKVSISIETIVAVLKALDVPIEIGPADSAGIGYRALRIPN